MVEFSQPRDGVPATQTDASAAFFVDRDPDLFAAILRYHDMVEFDLMALCNERSANGLPVTRKLLAQEAEYYNLQCLMDRISSATIIPPSSAVKYELYIIRKEQYSNTTKSYKFELSEVVGKQHSLGFPLSGLQTRPEVFLPVIQRIIIDKNMNEGSEGLHWTICAVTSANHESITVVIKGDQQQ